MFLVSVRKNKTLVFGLMAIVSFFLTLTCWAVSSPPGASPDDDYHLASSFCAHGIREGLCQPSLEATDRLVPAAIVSMQDCYSSQFSSAECAEKRINNLNGRMKVTNRVNSTGFYPQLFYFADGIFANSNLKTFVIVSRLFNIIIVILLFVMTYRYSNETIRRKIPLTLAVCSIPLGLSIFSSNNPSSWATTGLLSFALILFSVELPLRSKANFRKIIPLSIAAIAAIGSRPDSAVFLVIVVLGALLHIGSKFSYREIIRAVGISCLIILPPIWFFTSDALRSFYKNGFVDGKYNAPGLDVLNNNIQNLPQFIFGSFGFSFSEVQTKTGHLGWFNTPVPPLTSMIVFAVFVIVISKCVANWSRGQRDAVLFFIATFILLSLAIHQIDLSVIGQNVQPRYFQLFPFLIFGISIFNHHKKPFKNFEKILVVVSLTVGQAFALHLLIKRYTVGYGDFGPSLNRGVKWWGLSPVNPMVVWILATISFAFFSYSAVSLSNIGLQVDKPQLEALE